MRLRSVLQKHSVFWTIFLFCCLFFLLRFPSLFEPYWYGDEGIYHVIGRGLNAGRQMYVGVWDNKPPLLYVIYALFNADQFKIRLVSLFFGLCSVVVFFFLSRKLFQSFKISIITTFIFSLFFSLPIIEANIANAENFMVLPALLGGYGIFISAGRKAGESRKVLFLAGCLLGLSFLTKIVGLFDFMAFFFFLFCMEFKESKKVYKIKTLLQTYTSFLGGFLLPVILVAIYFVIQDTFAYFLHAALSGNVGYVGWKNDFLIPQGLLIFKGLLLSGFLAFLFIKRRKFSSTELFIYSWLACSLFNAFFSHRPYTHYQLVLLSSFSLAVGLLFLKQSIKKLLTIIVSLGLIFYIVYSHFDHWDISRTAGYYQNFFSFVSGKKDLTAYQSFFDSITPRDYKIAAYIKQHTQKNDTIFLWGNSAQIYVLSDTLPPGRYGVAYHIGTDREAVSETIKAMQKNKPKYIIIMPDQQQIPFDLHDYRYKATIEDTFIYERIN